MTKESVIAALEEVTDPEIPVLSIGDLGVIRDVEIRMEDGRECVDVVITPTYSGCPAMNVIATGIRMVLAGMNFKHVNIIERLDPPWTTDLMSESGKVKLKAYGIAPPVRKSKVGLGLFEEDAVDCPRCGSRDTELVSGFGPTSCKSLYKCRSCKEPFEHFKCH
jgi:ring-1,2-phenylacetyl-CoA epoxidase subunit PaaD